MTDTALVKEELSRVYELYGAQLRSFRRTLYVLIVAGLAVFAVIVVPFLTFRDQLAELQASEEQQAEARQEAIQRLAEIRSDLETVREIDGRVYAFAERYRSSELFETLIRDAREQDRRLADLRQSFLNAQDPGLRAWAAGERPAPPEEAVAGNRQLFGIGQRPCAWKTGVEHGACQICTAFDTLNRQLVHRLSRLSEASVLHSLDEAGALTPLAERACAWLDRGEVNWRTGEPLDASSFRGLRGIFSYDLMAYGEALETVERRLRELLPRAQTELERIERSRAVTAERLGVLESQLGRIASFDRLGTPIGDLPVGLGQIVLLFPVVMALAYVVLANSYARLAALRRAFARLCRQRDLEGAVMDAGHIAVIAPLWLDRSDTLGARIAKVVILIVPLLLILANLLLIHDTRALAEQLPDDAAITPTAYLVLYGVSLVLALGGLLHILRSARKDVGPA